MKTRREKVLKKLYEICVRVLPEHRNKTGHKWYKFPQLIAMWLYGIALLRHCIPTLISIYRYSELRKSDCIEQHHARGTGRNVVLRVLALKFSPSSLLKLGIIHSL